MDIHKDNHMSWEKYYFQRTCFLLDDVQYAEVVSLIADYYTYSDGVEHIRSDNFTSDSREKDLLSLPNPIVKRLENDEIIEEFIILNKNQYDFLKANYKNNLFAIDRNTVDSIRH